MISQMLVFPIIPIIALIIQTTYSLYDIFQYRDAVNEIEIQVNLYFNLILNPRVDTF